MKEETVGKLAICLVFLSSPAVRERAPFSAHNDLPSSKTHLVLAVAVASCRTTSHLVWAKGDKAALPANDKLMETRGRDGRDRGFCSCLSSSGET
jgi:hypothetical protein